LFLSFEQKQSFFKDDIVQMQTMETSLSNELLEGEELIWSGRPIEGRKGMTPPARRLQIVARIYVVLGLVLMLVVLIVEILIGDLSAGRETFIFLPGFFIIILGICMFLISKISTNFAPKATLYAITTQRIIILHDGRELRVMSFDKRAIKQVQRVEHPDGSGDLVFFSVPVSPGVYGNSAGNTGIQSAFRAISNVHLVERKLLAGMGQAINE
jgi:hypothetical protein